MLHLSPTPLTLWIGIVALIVVGGLCFISWKRSPHRGRTAALECLRFLSALAVVILLWQPEWLTIVRPDTKPQIAILWDDSKSMTTLDAALPPILSEKSEVISRADWVKKALASDLWKPLAAGGANEVVITPFSSAATHNPATSGTDLEAPLTELLAKQTNLRAVVMLSDGDYNLGQPRSRSFWAAATGGWPRL